MKLFKVCSTAIIVFLLSSVVLTGCGGGGGSAAPPAAPTGVTVTPGNGQVTVAWTTVSGATSYNIYWSTTAGVTPANGTKIPGATSPHPLTGLTNGTAYFFVVTAVNSAGESAPSSLASSTPALPVPTGVTATPGDSQVTIAWTTVPGATSYNIYWSTTAGVTPANGTQIPGATSPHAQTGLTNATTYYYVVTAVFGSTESAPSTQVSAIPAATAAPAAPTGVTATPGNGQVIIAWTAVPGATSYNIYWATATGVTPLNGIKITGATSPFTLTGLTNGTIYFFVVTAVNGNLESTPSSEVSALPSTTPSGKPFIQATVLSLTGLGNPLSWLQHVDVYTDSTLTTPITNAVVIVNTLPLAFDAVRGTYTGGIDISGIAPGAAINVSVTIGSTTYTGTGTQYTTFPIATAPALDTTWLAASANTITWTAGAPTAGAIYLVGILDDTSKIAYPAGNNRLINVPTSSTSFILPPNSIAAIDLLMPYRVILGIATAGTGIGTGNNTGGIPIANAAAGSGLWLGEITIFAPFAVQ